MFRRLNKSQKWLLLAFVLVLISGISWCSIYYISNKNNESELIESSSERNIIETNSNTSSNETKETNMNNENNSDEILKTNTNNQDLLTSNEEKKTVDENTNFSKNTSTENKNSVSSSNNNQTKPKTEPTKDNENDKNVEEKKEMSKPTVKTTCTNSNKGWNSFLNNYKKTNTSSMIFMSVSEAKAYGEYAMNNFGYGYWYNPIAEKYSDDECDIEFYAVQLYIPNNECTDKNGKGNAKIYIPATPKSSLIDNISYLVSKGYNCSNKCTIDGSKCY